MNHDLSTCPKCGKRMPRLTINPNGFMAIAALLLLDIMPCTACMQSEGGDQPPPTPHRLKLANSRKKDKQ